MKAIAFNGSPRKKWNTATLLSHALEGASSQGAETELVNLYDLSYQGCISCFECKRKGSKSYGRCAVRDDLKPLFERIEQADVLFFGSPIYLGAMTGEMRSFLERMIFPYLVYDLNGTSLFPRKTATGFIYTMGVPENQMNDLGYEQIFKITDRFLKGIFGSSESLMVTDTYQFDDYSKYEAPRFDPAAKALRRKEVFPEDCCKAFDMGSRLAKTATAGN